MFFPFHVRDPLFSPLPPFEGEAIAQTPTETKAIVQSDSKPLAPPTQVDLNSVAIAFVFGSGGLWLFLKTFGEKFGDSVLANRKTQSEIIKSQSDIALSEKKADLDQTRELFNLILETLKEERKTTKGILDILLTKYLSSTSEMSESVYTQQALLQSLIDRLNSQEKTLQEFSKNVNDIFRVLEMKTRQKE